MSIRKIMNQIPDSFQISPTKTPTRKEIRKYIEELYFFRKNYKNKLSYKKVTYYLCWPEGVILERI